MRVFNLAAAGFVAGALLFGSSASILAQGLFEAEPPSLQFEREVRSTYIVRLDNSLPSQAVNSRAREAAARFGGRIKYTYANTINGFAITMPSVAMARMTRAGGLDIISVTRDGIVSINAPGGNKGKPPKDGDTTDTESDTCAEEVPWGVARVTSIEISDSAGGCVVTDKGVAAPDYGASAGSVCVIDTGVDFDHPDLRVNQLLKFTAFAREGDDDLNGHGSHVAGTIGAKANGEGVVGVAPGVEIISVKVLNRRGSGSYSGVIAGVDWAAGNEACDVANMSLGGTNSELVKAVVRCAAADSNTDSNQVSNCSVTNVETNAAGIIFTIAAGNSATDASDHTPANASYGWLGDSNVLDNIHTIAAMGLDSNKDDEWAYFSNYGQPVDYIEPGVSILSTFKNGGYKTYSGTSMAAPHMAGIVIRGFGISTDGAVTRTGTETYNIGISDRP